MALSFTEGSIGGDIEQTSSTHCSNLFGRRPYPLPRASEN
jgi:hypothetical protein